MEIERGEEEREREFHSTIIQREICRYTDKTVECTRIALCGNDNTLENLVECMAKTMHDSGI